MNELESETDPVKLAALIAESDRESLMWQMHETIIKLKNQDA
jgi:hypothetical protein